MNIQHRDLITVKSLLRSAGSHVLRSAIPYCADQRVSYQRLVGSCGLLETRLIGTTNVFGFFYQNFEVTLAIRPLVDFPGAALEAKLAVS